MTSPGAKQNLDPSWMRFKNFRDPESVSRDVDLCREIAKFFGGCDVDRI